MTTAPYSRASSTISGSFARSPSIEKTPSVRMSLRVSRGAEASPSRSAVMSECG